MDEEDELNNEMTEEQKIEEKEIKSLKSAKIFKDHQKEVKSLDFSKDGKRLVTADDTMLNLYDIEKGIKLKTLYLTSKEIEQVKFTHNNEAVLCSTVKDHKVLYWSLHENEVINIFQGHSDQITTLEINPTKDQFLTCSKDKTLRLWDLQAKESNCTAKLDLTTKEAIPVGNYDPCGLIFAVAYQQEISKTQITTITLYDSEKQEKPFSTWKYDFNEVKYITICNSGKFILVSCAEGQIVLIDAYKGQELRKFNIQQNENPTLECCFSPCDNYIISGSDSGDIYIWNRNSEKEIAVLKGQHFLKSNIVKFNPKYFILASACKNVILWIPDKSVN